MVDEVSIRPSILVVDDTPDNLSLIHGLLREAYQVRVATSGTKALQLLDRGSVPDLALLDVMMPELDGYELCLRMKLDPRLRDIPVIFLSARTEISDEKKGFAAGGVDYIAKPICPTTLLARIEIHLRLHGPGSRDFRGREIPRQLEALLFSVASQMQSPEISTRPRLHRRCRLVRELATALSRNPQSSKTPTRETEDSLTLACILGSLVGLLAGIEGDDKKRKIAEDIFATARGELGSDGPLLSDTRSIMLNASEWWDGSGLPDHLLGEGIPLAARIAAVVDTFEATLETSGTSSDPTAAFEAVLQGSGNRLDPQVVEAFLGLSLQVEEILRRFP